MEEKRVKITKTQLVNGDLTINESIGTARLLTTDQAMIKIDNGDESLLILLAKDEATLKMTLKDGLAHIGLKLHQLTQGHFIESGHHTDFEFFLKTIYYSGFNLFLEYNISLHGELLAENALRTEVI